MDLAEEDSLKDSDHDVSLHKAGNPAVYTPCGNIPAEAPWTGNGGL